MALVWHLVNLIIVVSGVAWLVLFLINHFTNRVGDDSWAPSPDPYAFPPDDSRPRDPGTGEPSDYAAGLPVKPLPPTDTP